jgi:uncharacterized protein YecT (DUF1311 family)
MTKTTMLFLLLASMPALAEQHKQKDYEALNRMCLGDSVEKVSAIEYNNIMDGCADETSIEAKREINSLYKRLYSRLSTSSLEDANLLEQSQKSWVIYRNGECSLEATVGSPARGQCLMSLNIRRVLELRQLVGE